MFARFARLLRRTVAPLSERRPRTRLRCEALEARDVPAVITWTDGSGNHNFDTSSNWDLGRMPDSGDEVVFDGTVCNDDCNNTYSMTSYAAVRLVDGYSGTVTLDGWLITDTLELTSGTIDQPSPYYPGSTDIQVNTSFTWTGGTLNSTSSASTLHLFSATATIDAGGGSLVTGDNLSFEDYGSGSGSTVTVEPGTYTFNNDAIFTVSSLSTLTFDATAAINFAQNPNAANPNSNTGTIAVQGGKESKIGAPLVNAGEVSILGRGSTLWCQGAGYSYTQSAADAYTLIQAGAFLQADNSGVKLAGGTLSTRTNSAPLATSAHLEGNLLWTGGDMYFRVDTNVPNNDPGLVVSGDVTWKGGTLHIWVDASSTANSDRLAVDGSMTVDTTGAVKPTVVTTTVNGTPLANVMSWIMISSTGGITLTGNVPACSSTDGINLTVAPDAGAAPNFWSVKS